MKQNIHKMITGLLAGGLMLSVLLGATSCATSLEDSADTAQSDTSNVSVTEATTVSETETAGIYETLDKEHFNREFAICMVSANGDMYVEDGYTGSVLSDALVDRNTTVSEDFDIDIQFIFAPNGGVGLNDELVTQATSGTDDYDLYIGYKDSFGSCAQGGFCYDLNEVYSLNLDQPRWDQSCYENLSINNRTYLVTGDISPTAMRYRSCIVFNKDLLTDLTYSVSELNQLAADGKWTLDSLHDYTARVSSDLNGDGKLFYEDDRYGLVGWRTSLPFNVYYGSGKPFISIVDGVPEFNFTSSDSEKMVDIYDKFCRIVYDQNAYFVIDGALVSTYFEVFRDGRALFCDTQLYDLGASIAGIGMEDAYGILPTPKYDEKQEQYQSFVNGASPLCMMSRSEKDAEFVGTIMDAMAAYNYENITPNMYEIVTKLQVAQDPESAQMIDVILQTAVYDMAYYADFKIAHLFCVSMIAGDKTIASALAATTRKVTSRELPNLIQSFEKID